MADCYAPETDDLHRRWLPREIFADIGIADATPPAEDLAVHLTGILGGKAAAPLPPLPPYHHQQQHAAQVCGLDGRVVVAYLGGSHGDGAAAAAWPFFPYSPVQWQVGTNFPNGGGGGGGILGPRHAPLRPCHSPPPAKRRLGGTGVFLPRAEVYQYQHKAAAKSPAKDGKPSKQQQQRGDEEDATGMKRQWQWQQGETTMQQQQQEQKNASAALLALPQEWTY